MKRHFSNRGEALAEVTAARSLASRKGSIRRSFMIQADRRIGLSIWLRPPKETAAPPKRKQKPSLEKITPAPVRTSEETYHDIHYENAL
jgi:hypothetical protein